VATGSVEERGAWWEARQRVFTAAIGLFYTLLVLLTELGVLRGDRIGWSVPALWMYGIGILVALFVANLSYVGISHSERLVKPRNVTAYRRFAFAVAIAMGLGLPWGWALLP
jgi:hypothetical protein